MLFGPLAEPPGLYQTQKKQRALRIVSLATCVFLKKYTKSLELKLNVNYDFEISNIEKPIHFVLLRDKWGHNFKVYNFDTYIYLI